MRGSVAGGRITNHTNLREVEMHWQLEIHPKNNRRPLRPMSHDCMHLCVEHLGGVCLASAFLVFESTLASPVAHYQL